MEYIGQRLHLRRVGVLSVGGIMAVIYAILGLIIGVFVTIAALFGTSLGGTLFGIGAIIILPILYGIVGFIGGLITALIYNWAAKFTGGIEMEFGTG